MKIIHAIVYRFQLVLWGGRALLRASAKDTLLLLNLFVGRGMIPVLSLVLMRKIIFWLTNEYESTTFPILITLSWASLLLFEKFFAPFVTILQVRLNEKVLAYFHLQLISKANSFQGMQPFETGELHEQIQYLENESARRPMNFVYIFCDSISELVTIVSLIVLMIDISPLVGIAIFISAIPHAVSTTWFEKIRWNHTLFSGKYAQHLRWITSVSLKNETAKELRLFGFATFMSNKYKQHVAEFVRGFSSHCWREILPALGLTTLTVIANTAIFCWSIILASNNRLSIAGTIVSLQAFMIMQSKLTDVLQEVAMVQPVLDFFDRFKQFLLMEDLSLSLVNATKKITNPIHEIRFHNVSFIYPDGRQALSDINLTITAGSTTALVGENGAGKSTLIKLLLRFYDPTSGAIFVDGVNLKEICPQSWRKQFSAVFQDYGKYFFTAEESIQIGRGVDSLDKEKVSRAAHLGQFAQVAEKLPEKMQTQIGQELSGTGLSEGEWQKLAISRACMKDTAKFLILDEPSASLDPRSEHELFQTFSRLSFGKTVFFVTHRLGSVKLADRVVMMKEGSIIEEGTHSSLMKDPSQYSVYYSLQATRYDSALPN